MGHARHTVGYEKLSAEAHAFLRQTVGERGLDPTARLLGTSETTIELAFGLGLRKATRDRLEARLQEFITGIDELPPTKTARAKAAPPPLREQTRLTGEQVAEMRRRHVAGERQAALARAYGISATTVSRIVHGISRGAA